MTENIYCANCMKFDQLILRKVIIRASTDVTTAPCESFCINGATPTLWQMFEIPYLGVGGRYPRTLFTTGYRGRVPLQFDESQNCVGALQVGQKWIQRNGDFFGVDLGVF